MGDLVMSDDDRYIWETELSDFLPQRIFDAHTHLYDVRFMDRTALTPAFVRDPRVDWADLMRYSAALFPGREVHCLAFGFPQRGSDMPAMNEFVAEEVRKDPKSAALMLADPRLPAREIERTLERSGFRGFKPYLSFSINPDPDQSTVLEMLPESYWKIADERKLVVVIHLSRFLAIADPLNQAQVRQLAEKYPRVKVQLAHCARCFTPQNAEAGLPAIADLPNVHVDTSAVCETEVFQILLDVWPRERIVFGTDNAPPGTTRGKTASFGRGWYSIQEDNTAVFNSEHMPYKPTYAAYENLRGLRYAAKRHGWGPREREDFFLNNARRLLGLT